MTVMQRERVRTCMSDGGRVRVIREPHYQVLVCVRVEPLLSGSMGVVGTYSIRGTFNLRLHDYNTDPTRNLDPQH